MIYFFLIAFICNKRPIIIDSRKFCDVKRDMYKNEGSLELTQ